MKPNNLHAKYKNWRNTYKTNKGVSTPQQTSVHNKQNTPIDKPKTFLRAGWHFSEKSAG